MSDYRFHVLVITGALLGTTQLSAPNGTASAAEFGPVVRLASVGPIGGAWPAAPQAQGSCAAPANCPSATASPPSVPPSSGVRAEPKPG